MSVDRTAPGQRPSAVPETPAEGAQRRRRQWIGLGVLGALVVILFASCVSTANRSNFSSTVDDSTAKYTQTWPESYSSTTCEDWNTQMTDAQHFAAAADMLTASRVKGDGGSGVAPDSLISEFQSGMTTACVIPTYSISEVGALLYLTDRERFRP